MLTVVTVQISYRTAGDVETFNIDLSKFYLVEIMCSRRVYTRIIFFMVYKYPMTLCRLC